MSSEESNEMQEYVKDGAEKEEEAETQLRADDAGR
jgi:hypothetical protein